MKQSTLIIVLLSVLILFGWVSAFMAPKTEETEEYTSHVKLAEEYMERGLYQKAMEEYEALITLSNTEENWDALLKAYQKRYEESTKIYSEYLSVAERAVAAYGMNADYLKCLVELYLENEDYKSAYKTLTKAMEAGVENKELSELLLVTKYAYRMAWESYSTVVPYVNGYYLVQSYYTTDDVKGWNYVDETGATTGNSNMMFASIVGENGVRLVYDGKKAQLLDDKDVIQGFVKVQPTDASMYSEGLIAICDGEKYSYYDLLGDKKFGSYEMAGSFIDGEAAVCENGKWFLIDQTGAKISSDYEEIVLNVDKTHKKNGVMIAKSGESYTLLKGEENIGSYDDVDVITEDGILAVCKNNKWGFVDLNGNEVIKPEYAKAKSFSGGLAAVSNGELWGFINRDGELVIDYIFCGADYFNANGMCMVEVEEGMWKLLELYIK